VGADVSFGDASGDGSYLTMLSITSLNINLAYLVRITQILKPTSRNKDDNACESPHFRAFAHARFSIIHNWIEFLRNFYIIYMM
jgi:hypothetical protein